MSVVITCSNEGCQNKVLLQESTKKYVTIDKAESLICAECLIKQKVGKKRSRDRSYFKSLAVSIVNVVSRRPKEEKL